MSDIIENSTEEINIFQEARINRIAVMILAGYSKIEVSRECKLSDLTIREIMKDENFKRTLQLASAKIFDAAIAKLCLNSCKAVDVVIAILEKQDASDRTKLQAASLVLQIAEKSKTAQLEVRLEALESLVNSSVN